MPLSNLLLKKQIFLDKNLFELNYTRDAHKTLWVRNILLYLLKNGTSIFGRREITNICGKFTAFGNMVSRPCHWKGILLSFSIIVML